MQEEKSRRILAVVAVVAGLAVVVVLLATCSDNTVKNTDPVARGWKIFRTLCIACHHTNPHKEFGDAGTWGPPVAGSSLDLIRLRVLKASYPVGYQPKRKSTLMTTFNLKEDQLAALYAFMNQPDHERREGDSNRNGK